MSIELAELTIKKVIGTDCSKINVISLNNALIILDVLYANAILSFKLEVNDGDGVLVVDDLDICCEVVV